MNQIFPELETSHIAELSSLDHFLVLLDRKPDAFQRSKDLFEEVGFPLSFESGKESNFYRSHTPFIGREYFDLIQVKRNPVPSFPDSLNRWEDDGMYGVVGMVLRTGDIDTIYRYLEHAEVYVKEPYRENYVMHHQVRTSPWQYLDLPPIEAVPLQIRWIQLDPMVENMMFSGLSPNSKNVNGVSGIDEVDFCAPFTEADWILLEKVFPALDKNRDKRLPLKNGALKFTQASKPSVSFTALTGLKEFDGQKVQAYNFSISVLKRS